MWWSSASGDIASLGALAGFMNDDERRRFEAMRRPQARDQFALGCALMRVAAGHHLGAAPGDVLVERRCVSCGGPHGKPRILGDSGLEISLSHTDGHVVCAVARGTPVGVDVEDGATLMNGDLLAGDILAPREAEVYRQLRPEHRRSALLTYWTRKEAVLKATGHGLRVPMRRLELSGPAEEPRLLRWSGRPEPPRVTLRTLYGPASSYLGHAAAALAVLGEPPQLIELDAEPAFAPWRDHDG
ncbi:hypothetical protein Pth03_27650 [Planotetraspora thailandica]|uniref:4'-phosphopantetheinyl transferase domain-containing protein n=1 Tax=Planotetraspora thailandica TaxID=487172 RepID=A0A8J3V3L3_9ACTN|nr:hypothetical protein Pth03_27650 [Planotetraspora thailandica]